MILDTLSADDFVVIMIELEIASTLKLNNLSSSYGNDAFMYHVHDFSFG